jgi:hypothetical protein
MAIQSIQKSIQSGFYNLLFDNSVSLKVDDRVVTISLDIPDSEFSQKQFPKVAVFRPIMNTRIPVDSNHVEMQLSCPFLILDVNGANFAKEMENRERLDLLAYAIMKLIDNTVSFDMSCVDIQMYRDFRWTLDENLEEMGNNLTALLLTLELRVVAPKNLTITV